FYCNVNDAWTFEKRAHRLWVTFAGGWIQLVVAAFAAIAWVMTEPRTAVNDFAFLTLLIGGGLTVLVNFNPLIPLDGYYALVDWLGIPNLRARAFKYFGARFKQVVLRARGALPPASDREARIFLVYGGLSALYIVGILSLFALGIAHWLTGKWGIWGFAIFAFLFWRATGRLRQRLASAYHAVRASNTLRLMMRNRRALAAGGAIVLLLLMPWTVRVSAPAVAESLQRVTLTPAEAARVERVLVAENSVVARGQPVAILKSPALDLEWTRARAAAHVLERELQAARLRQDAAAARSIELELATRAALLERLAHRREALVLRAPFDARVLTPHVDVLAGAWVNPGDTLLELQSSGALRARLSLAERDVADLARGDVVKIKFPVRAAWTWQSHVAEVAPAAIHGRVDVIVPLLQPAADAPVLAGMVGLGKVAVRRTNLLGAAARIVRRVLRTDLIL
ncbi:MAG: efflux RND transporter periplasmic adaptor subunit, partial [Gemmatimonadota bacterium]